MAEAPRYRDGHAVAAAVRVVEAREGRPPTVDEIAETLGWHPDKTSVVVRALSELGILSLLENPYDVRYEIRDHLALEKLEDDEGNAGFADELAAFQDKVEEEQAALESVFDSGEPLQEQKKRVRDLDAEFEQFRKGKPDNPFRS